MPAEWTTAEQKAFLREELVLFKRIGGRHYTKHWQSLFQRWSQRWSERLTALPGVAEDAVLTPMQQKTLAVAVAARHKQIRAWMHWHAGAGQTRSANNKMVSIIKDLLKPKARAKKLWEIYSRRYYLTRIQPTIKPGTSIADINKKTRELFENETPEIKEEIRMISEQQKRDYNKSGEQKGEPDDSDDDDEDIILDPSVLRRYVIKIVLTFEALLTLYSLNSNIQQCGGALQRILHHLGKQTGWKFTVLMGGPDPLDPDIGNIITRSVFTYCMSV